MSSRFLSICALEKRETEQGVDFFLESLSAIIRVIPSFPWIVIFCRIVILVVSTSKYTIFSDRIFFLRPFNIFGILKNARKISLNLARIQGREDTFPIEKEKRETRSWLAAALSATLRSARNGSPQFVRLKLCPGIPINLSPSLFPPLDPIALGPLVPRDISFGNAVERRIFTYPRVLSCTCICTRRVLPSPPPHEGMPTIF